MSKRLIDAATVLFTPPNQDWSGGKWSITPQRFHGTSDVAIVTFEPNGENTGGGWSIHPLPFIIGHDLPDTLVTCYDSVTLGPIGRLLSSSKDAIAAYDDGLFKNLQQAKIMFPLHHVLSISVRFGDQADYGDSETGDMSSAQAIVDVENGNIRGIYANLDRWNTELVPLLKSKPHLKPLRWVADWTGHPHLPTLDDGVEADACQYFNRAGGLNVDVSLFKSSAL